MYRVQGYVDGVLTYTEDDIDGNSATWTPADEGLLTVEVHAKRDGLYSWQAPAHSFYYAPNSIIYTIEGNERRTEEGSLRITED